MICEAKEMIKEVAEGSPVTYGTFLDIFFVRILIRAIIITKILVSLVSRTGLKLSCCLKRCR